MSRYRFYVGPNLTTKESVAEHYAARFRKELPRASRVVANSDSVDFTSPIGAKDEMADTINSAMGWTAFHLTYQSLRKLS